MSRILVTGAAGFIGSHFVDYVTAHHEDEVVVLDKLTYAGDMTNLEKSREEIEFIQGDICVAEDLEKAFEGGIDRVVNFAAETHVDNSIGAPLVFAETNVLGTLRLLMFSLRHGVERFLQISTDEVYGSREEGYFREDDLQEPSSAYAATKSGAEKLVWAYHVTHGLPVLITRSSNNYGPRQNPEKFIPKVITSALNGEPIPVYGTGQNQRDWIFVRDNCAALDVVLREGQIGEAYNVGAQCLIPNIELARKIVDAVGASRDLIEFVTDRKGHDFRYALTTEKIEGLGWKPETTFDAGL
jgi:dTDP-glucose 4,6-dehydratase